MGKDENVNGRANAPPKAWRKLTERMEEFQEILKLLVEFDERTHRHRRQKQPELHHMRRALAVGRPKDLEVFIRYLGGSMFFVAAKLTASGGQVASGWLHEDGIYEERQQFADNPDHPVHMIRCMSDLFAAHTETAPNSEVEARIPVQCRELLEEVGDWERAPEPS